MKFYEHPIYKTMLPDWVVYADFYKGDKKTLIMPEYLIPHEFEITEKGRQIRLIREQRTEYTNHIEAFIKRFISLIFRKSIDLSLISEILPQEELTNIDGNETTLENFIKNQIAPLYFLYGKVGVYIDSLNIQAKSKLEEQELGLRPFAQVVDPRELIDWQYSDTSYGKELDFAVWRYQVLEQRVSATEEPTFNTYVRYLYKDVNGYNIDLYKLEDKDNYKLVANQSIDLDFIPLAILESDSWIKGAMPKARQLYNLESVLDNIHLFQAHQRIIATGDFKSDSGGQVAANEGNLLLLNGNGAITVVSPADTIAIERRIEQVKMDMIKIVFHQQRHLPADSAVAEGWQTMREAKEDFRSIAVNAAKDLQNFVNNFLYNYLLYKNENVEREEFVVLDTNVSETDVTEFMLWLNAFASSIQKYPTWQKAVDKEAAKKMNLPQTEEILDEIENNNAVIREVNDPINSVFEDADREI